MTRTNIINSVMALYNNYYRYPDITEQRLYFCKADIIQTTFSKWIILRSYTSVVAAYDQNAEILYVFNYYSATTSQHVAKFRKWLLREMNPCRVKRVNLYNDSRTSKRVATANIADDFESVIAALEK